MFLPADEVAGETRGQAQCLSLLMKVAGETRGQAQKYCI